MNKNALTEKRRETVISMLKGMKIKESSSGEGFDKADVLGCMQQLCDLYEEHIDELEKTYEAEIGDLTSKYQKYDDNNDLYISLIMEAKKSSNDLIEQAKAEVEDILEEGRNRIELQEKEILLLRERSEKEKVDLAKEMAQTRELYETELAAMKVEVEAEKEKVEAIRSRYRQQTEAMTSDFDDIKTNVLRTAAKLDNLKNQVEAVETEISWAVEAKPVSVEFPTGDITIEDELPIEVPAVEVSAETPETSEPEVPAEPVAEIPQEEDIAETEAVAPAEPEGLDIASIIGTQPEAPAEENVDSFADTFFKSEVLEEMPKAHTEEITDVLAEPEVVAPVEQATIEEPVEDFALEEPALEVPIEVEQAPAETPEISIPAELPVAEADLSSETGASIEEDIIESVDDVEELLDKISFDDMLEDLPETGIEVAEDDIEEISFEGLEELFKDE